MKERIPELQPEQQTTVREELQKELNNIDFTKEPIRGLDVLEKLEQEELREKQEKRREEVLKRI